MKEYNGISGFLVIMAGAAIGYLAAIAVNRGKWWLASLILGVFILVMLSVLAWGIYGVLTE